MELSRSVSVIHSDTVDDSADGRTKLHDDTLLKYLEKNNQLHVFLRVTGIRWTDGVSSLFINLIQCLWSGYIRCGLGVMFFWGIGGNFMVQDYSKQSVNTRICLVVYCITLILQSFTLCMSLFAIDKRLKGPVRSHDDLFVNASLTPSYIVLVTSMILGIIPEIIYIAVTGLDRYFALVLGQLAICFVMSVTTFFITADCQVACKLVDDLTEQQRQETLTFEQFTLVRNDIHRRERCSYWVNNSLVLVTLLDVMAVVLFIFLDVLSYNSWYLFAFIISLFLKEIPFLFVVFWHVSQVNEKAAVFLREMSVRQWTNCDVNDGKNSVLDRNNERRDICISAQAFPIAYTLAGLKLKRRDLLWQLLVWLIAFVIGILKKLVEDGVEG